MLLPFASSGALAHEPRSRSDPNLTPVQVVAGNVFPHVALVRSGASDVLLKPKDVCKQVAWHRNSRGGFASAAAGAFSHR